MSFVFFFFFHRNIAMESTPSAIQQQHMPTNRTADHFSFPTIATTMVCSCRVGSNREYHRPCKINVLGVGPVLRSFYISICICISPLGLFRLLSVSFSLSLSPPRTQFYEKLFTKMHLAVKSETHFSVPHCCCWWWRCPCCCSYCCYYCSRRGISIE